jgi:septation ring formation regulator EzrA
MIMDNDISPIGELRVHIDQVEEKLTALRVSRRILMNLLDNLEKEKCEQLALLENQNNKLRKSNWHYAQTIMFQNSRIAKLEEKFKLFSTLT